MTQTATIGRIVHYVLNDNDVSSIKAVHERDRAAHGVHAGGLNVPSSGDVYPAVVVRVWGDNPTAGVNLHVMLDGALTYWATSKQTANEPTRGFWHWPPRV